VNGGSRQPRKVQSVGQWANGGLVFGGGEVGEGGGDELARLKEENLHLSAELASLKIQLAGVRPGVPGSQGRGGAPGASRKELDQVAHHLRAVAEQDAAEGERLRNEQVYLKVSTAQDTASHSHLVSSTPLPVNPNPFT